jgi:[ribosomal protein S18]-alanine N-acetyltransferase
MNAVLKPSELEARFEPFTPEHANALVRIEMLAYTFPWTHANFLDSHRSGYQMQMLTAGGELLGYFVAMRGVDEVHLLNITVAPEYQGQGWARLMLDGLSLWTRGQDRHWLWLEVRLSNTRAIALYERYGFGRVGLRKSYYPAKKGREDAVVMSLNLSANPNQSHHPRFGS